MLSSAVVAYLFLGGAGAGACALLAIMGFMVPADRLACRRGISRKAAFAAIPGDYARLFFPGYLAATAALALGIVLLFADLGSPDKVLLLLVHPKLTYLAVGAYALAACVLLSGASALVWRGILPIRAVALLRVLGAFQLAASCTVMVYTGLLLSDIRAVALWFSPWLAPLFTASALSCGAALLLVVGRLFGSFERFPRVMRGLERADCIIVVFEALFVIAFSLSIAQASCALDPTSRAAAFSLALLLTGDTGLVFWMGFVVCGLLVPFAGNFALQRVREDFPFAGVIVSVCALAGGFALRWCVVFAGAHPAVGTMLGA